MAALTEDRNTEMKQTELVNVKVAASTKIYAGSIVMLDTNGYAKAGATAANQTYFGCADEFVDNSTGGNGAKSINVRRGRAFKFANSGSDAVDQTSVGKVCYIEDDQTVAKTHNSNAKSAAGIVLGVASDGVWVQ